MKKTLKTALIVLLAITMLVALVACNGGTISIYNSPQTTYVLGQELDLSKGTLRVDNSGETVALNSSDVKVTGYDKNKLGEQELTVTYQKMTTTFTVTVVERFVAARVTTDYFVGETFDGKGNFTVTRDDGSKLTVAASDVVIDNFDTSSVGKSTVSLHFQDYVGNYDITVHEAAGIELLPPSKTNYQSHEPLNVTSGIITIKNTDGSFTKSVSMTEDMVTGFDPSLATINNATSPLMQELTVSFGGLTAKYRIYITYSNVTLIHSIYQEYLDVDTITDELAERMFDATSLYFGLSRADKAYIADEEITTMVQIAAAYGRIKWMTEYQQLIEALEINSYGEFVFVGSYEQTKAAYDILVAPDCAIIATGTKLAQLASEFPNISMPGTTTTVSGYLNSVLTLAADFSNVIRKMDFMFSFYDNLKVVPTDATVETLFESYSEEINSIANLIRLSSFDAASDRDVYAVAARWHMDNFFDLLYQFYLDDNNVDMLGELAAKQLPGKLETIYRNILDAMDQLEVIQYAYALGELQGIVVDSTLFMLYYRNVVDMSNDIVNGSNELYKSIYQLTVFTMYREYLDTYGYTVVMDTLVGNRSAENFWNHYLDIVANYIEVGETYLGGDLFASQITNLLEEFVALSPVEQFDVIRSLYPAYDYLYPEVGLELNNGGSSLFTYFLNSYYRRVLTEDGYRIFYYYLPAIEYYVNTNDDYYGDFMDMFNEIVNSQTLNSIYNFTLQEDDLQYISNLHDKVQSYKNNYNNQNTNAENNPISSDVQALFDELAESVNQVIQADMFIESDVPVFSLLIASYERAQQIADQILASNDSNAIDAYYHRKMYHFGSGVWTMEYALSFARSMYVFFLVNYESIDYNAYHKTNLPQFLAKVAPLMWEGVSNLFGQEMDLGFAEPTTEDVADILAYFRELSLDNKEIFMLWLDTETGLYYRGLRHYFERVLADFDDVSTLIDDVFSLETLYLTYQSNPDGVNSDDVAYSQLVQEALDRLSGELDLNETNADYQLLVEIYNYYLQAFAN